MTVPDKTERARLAQQAQQARADLVEQLQAFKSGARAATIMHQIAKGFSDEQIKTLASYFASQQP